MALTPEQQALDFNPELQDVSRQQKLAELLMAKGAQSQPQGQMISGYYVAPSWSQQLNPMANLIAGQAVGERADTKQAELAVALRTQGDAAAKDVMETYKQDPQAALAKATQYQQYPQVKALLPQLSKVALPEATTLEREFIAAKNQGYKGNINDFKNQMSEYQKVQAANDKQRLGLEGARLNLEQQKAAQELQYGKPLPEGALKQVTGATNLKDAVANYQEKLKGFSKIDFANPNSRAKMGEAYNNMMLQAKEAYNLGVLNGPDYAILTSIVTDPTSPKALLVKKDTLNEQAAELNKISNNIIKNVYTTHNRPVPAGINVQQQMPQAQQVNQIDPKLLQYMTPEQQALFKPKGQ
jgi:hypothetical protein